MFGPQQVVYCLHGVEGGNRYLYKNCIPVAHGPIPQARHLQRLELLPALRLVGDESGIGIDKPYQVELVTLIVSHTTDHVNRIKMRPFSESIHRTGIIFIDLGTLQDLERGGTIGINRNKGTTTGLTHILYHSTHPERTVEFSFQISFESIIVIEIPRT